MADEQAVEALGGAAGGERVLVTGASSGIGLELARLFAADRCALVLVARRRERLDQLAGELSAEYGVEVKAISRDLADASTPPLLFEELAGAGSPIDVLVNNAGFGAAGPFAELPVERQLEMIQVNLTALVHLTRLFLPGMIERGRGAVLNVGSTAGFQPGPYMAVYYATKAFVLSFSEAVAEEVASTGVTVTCLAPGPTTTEFIEAADIEASPLAKFGPMDAASVARAGFRGFRAGKTLVVPGVKNKLGAASVRLAPRPWVRKLAARLNQSR